LKNKKNNESFKNGERCLILDLGGGTADMSAMEIVDDFYVKELYPPDGGPFGSTYIDKAFLKLFETIIGEKEFKQLQTGKSSHLILRLENEIRISKENFSQSLEKNNVYHSMNLPIDIIDYFEDDSESKINIREKFNDFEFRGEKKMFEIAKRSQVLKIHENVWKHLFDIVVDPIIAKMNDIIINANIIDLAALCLIGGLSQSLYVRQRISEFIKNKYVHCSIISPNNPILAIVCGASHLGMSIQYVKSIKLRKHYGIAVVGDVRHGYSVICEKGMLIDSDEQLEPKPYVVYRHQSKPYSARIRLFTSESNKPPQYVDDPQCELEGQLTFQCPDQWDIDKDHIYVKYVGFLEGKIRAMVKLADYDMKIVEVEFDKEKLHRL